MSRVTIQKIERGDPTVALGSAFEAATIVGVPLFHAQAERRSLEAARVADLLPLLPDTVRLRRHDDDF